MDGRKEKKTAQVLALQAEDLQQVHDRR